MVGRHSPPFIVKYRYIEFFVFDYRAFDEWLQCNSVEKYERYREKNVETKQKVEEAKRMSNFKWGQDFDRLYEKNKKKFWKEVRKGGSRTEETVKVVNGRLLR